MTFDGKTILYIALALVLFYGFFSWRERQRLMDEREQLIDLKALSFVHSLIMAEVCFFGFIIPWVKIAPMMVVLVIGISALYGEMGAKFYLRKRL